MSTDAQQQKTHLPTNEFISQRVRDYYSKERLPDVKTIEQREFGTISPPSFRFRRHMGFEDMKALARYLVNEKPAHMYYSSAYYEIPGAPTMAQKKWLGADLVFDLDADHIPGAENLSYAEMLASVKVEFIKLVEDFLLGDFGFDEKDIGIYFSGGRGYHAHVRHASVLGLNSHERREIVNYITLPNHDISSLLKREVFDVKEFRGHITEKYVYALPDPDAGGWKGKLRNGVLDYLNEGLARDENEIVKELEVCDGIGKKSAKKLWSELFDGDMDKSGASKIIATNKLEAFSDDRTRNLFLKFIMERTRIMAGETDEPVTSDIKRLIRLPGSLHGKTGFMVRSLTLDQLGDFDPLVDAVWDGHPGETKIMGLADFDFSLMGEDWKLKEKEELALPTAAAFFAVLQKKARIAD
ncbi:MAG: DNA primase catalytic subunit PriS [Thermoplasmata archaeon]|nr:DNA primase catalytic subunit PriS [Thermoplasmata archaeon]